MLELVVHNSISDILVTSVHIVIYIIFSWKQHMYPAIKFWTIETNILLYKIINPIEFSLMNFCEWTYKMCQFLRISKKNNPCVCTCKIFDGVLVKSMNLKWNFCTGLWVIILKIWISTKTFTGIFLWCSIHHVHSLVAIFVVGAGVGRVSVGGRTAIILDTPPGRIPGGSTRRVAIPAPASCSPVIAQVSSSNRWPFSR